MKSGARTFIEHILEVREVGAEVEHAVRVLLEEDSMTDAQTLELIGLLLEGKGIEDKEGHIAIGGVTLGRAAGA